MQQNPQTPTKADDSIERVKQSLTAKWGITFPERDPFLSPSRRDSSRPEEKILTLIQFLYFRGGALDFALADFEKNAANIHSEWQYKPRADPDIIPIRERSKQHLERVFLRKRENLPPGAVKELTASLLHHLTLIGDRVKGGKKYPLSRADKGYEGGLADDLKNRVAYGVTDPVKSSVEDHPPIKAGKVLGQSHLTKWFRNKSAPGASAAHEEAAQYFSSDEYADSEMVDILADEAMLDTTHSFSAAQVSEKMESPTHEVFKTPPTTPPPSSRTDSRLDVRLQNNVNVRGSAKSGSPACSTDLGATKKRPFEDLEPMPPPPIRKISHEKKSGHMIPTFAAPGPPLEPHHLPSRSSSSSHSFDNLPSVSSSFTSNSSTWTSPNTSSCASSVSTSFDSTSEDTDTTIKPSLGQFRSKQLTDHVSPWAQYDDSISEGASTKRHSEGLGGEHGSLNNDSEPCFNGNDHILEGQSLATPDVEKQLLDRLLSYPPFVPISDQFSMVPLRQLYEVSRASLDCKIPLSEFSDCLDNPFEQYDQLWDALHLAISRSKKNTPTDRSSLQAWNRATGNFDRVALAGRLKFRDQASGPVFELSLHPLKIESSYRFARKFGHDRFCTIQLPSLGSDGLPPYLKSFQALARTAIIKWLVETEHSFLGRTWRAFYVKPESMNKGKKCIKVNASEARWRIYLFAEDGVNFRAGPIVGEPDPRISIHSRISVKELLDWHMPPNRNADQSVLKFFNRLGLGLTTTVSTFVFRPREIIRSDDAHSETSSVRKLDFARSESLKTGRNSQKLHSAVMNDGCARISRDAARAVADMLGLDQVPSAFQGRIGGAKGVWMVDALDERPSSLTRPDGNVYWIEISQSQLKFNPHGIDSLSPDTDRVTFEVNKCSKKLFSSPLSFQLLPILEDRGVPQEVLTRLLREDLSARVSEMKVAMDDGIALRKWNQDNNPITHERLEYGGIEMAGGLPETTAEKINWFVEHGFEPKTCLFLKDQLWKSIRSYCLRLESRTNIGLGRCTTAFMIADPLGVLDEDEIHFGFSSIFRDGKSSFNETMLYDRDVLVARLPAHLPSDIQKVRAVCNPRLLLYKDVVVFPSKGKVPLASKLSGGDYDGDTAWVCWEPDVVNPFQNANVPEFGSLKSYQIEKDDTKVSDLLPSKDYANQFLRHSFHFNLQMSMLGICSNYHEALCYHNNNIDSPEAVNIAVLLGYLVDSAKGGFKYDEAQWTNHLKRLGLNRMLEPPAYKDRKKSREKKESLIDQLVFRVAKEEREKILRNFDEHFQNVPSRDEDLVRRQKLAAEEAKTNVALHSILKNLKIDLEEILTYWKKHAKREDDEDDSPVTRKGATLSFRSVVKTCRDDFLAVRPKADEGETCSAVKYWQLDHSSGISSNWDLLKASVAFHHFHKSVSFIWHTAGVELGEIKATKGGRGSYRIVVNPVHDTFKMNGKMVNGRRHETPIAELPNNEVDNDDEFGSDVDIMDL